MIGAGLAAAMVLGIAGLLYVDRRWRRSRGEHALELVLRALPGAERIEDRDGAPAVRAIVRGVHVIYRCGLPPSGEPAWAESLGASARFVVGAGPAFRAAGDPEDHLRVAAPDGPLRMLYGRSIPVVGEHRDARPLITRTFTAIEPTRAMLAPHLRSNGEEVSAWLARVPADEHLPDVVRSLGELVAGLARWQDDVLDEYAAATGAAVVVDPFGSPPLTARIGSAEGQAPIVLEARYQREATSLVGPHTFGVRAAGPAIVSIPRERVPLERIHPDAMRRLGPELVRRASRALVRGDGDDVVVEWAQPPPVAEMLAAVEVLRALAPARPETGPFR